MIGSVVQRTAVVILCAGLLLAGCARGQAGSAAPATRPAGENQPPPRADARPADIRDVSLTDPCANRLHDLAGSLLLYHAIHQRLPERLTDLEQITGPLAPAALVCPVSKSPYTYNPDGLLSPDTKSLLVVYDSAATHDGRRQAISVTPPADPTDALVTKITSLPNQAFQPAPLTP